MAKRYYETDLLSYEEQQFAAGFYREQTEFRSILEVLPLLIPLYLSGFVYMAIAVAGSSVPEWLTNLGTFAAWMFFLASMIISLSFTILNYSLGETRSKYLAGKLADDKKKKFEQDIILHMSGTQLAPSMAPTIKWMRRSAITLSIIGLVMAGHFFLAFFILFFCAYFVGAHAEYKTQMMESIKALAAKSPAPAQ